MSERMFVGGAIGLLVYFVMDQTGILGAISLFVASIILGS